MIETTNQFQESIDTFKVKFEGGNSIDAELFTRTINNIIELVKASANAIDPNSFLRLEIKATKEGSFETIIDAVAKYTPDLINKDNARLACEIVGGFLAFLQIKSHLKGRKPKSINYQDQSANIENHEGQVIYCPKNIGQVYVSDSKVDNIISNIFIDLKESQRNGLVVEHNTDTKSFKKEDCDTMSTPIIDQSDSLETREETQIIERCELLIKKVDFLGNSKWEMIFDKKIQVTIKDEDFLKKIKSGVIKISGGYKLICSLEITREIDENYDVLNTEYAILKVHEIKDNQSQLEMF